MAIAHLTVVVLCIHMHGLSAAGKDTPAMGCPGSWNPCQSPGLEGNHLFQDPEGEAAVSCLADGHVARAIFSLPDSFSPNYSWGISTCPILDWPQPEPPLSTALQEGQAEVRPGALRRGEHTEELKRNREHTNDPQILRLSPKMQGHRKPFCEAQCAQSH